LTRIPRSGALSTPFGYPAGGGYDIAIGWCTANVANLVASLSG
jgi:hypothetical protein